ncbi:hypothetical protein BCU71_19325 [Vibrio lentus]|uniref:hypothetical protein n=1 Tax=Vibrio lentus TaxID=136468 RepID=UPI000C81BE26|nr:hypothetical protein [Vibrio lentus]PMH28892.1 hypothetical protein BCU71_19325 [Vibrio lentus]PMK68445.1 hypothetical protein BCT93_18405 [Vibrio lentus]
MKNIRLYLKNIDYLIVFILILIPILRNPYALWDGAILNYSSTIYAPEVISSIFSEAGAPFATLVNLSIYYISYLSGIESKTVYSIFISAFTFVLYAEIIKMLSFRLSLTLFERVLIAFAFCALPFWSSFLSDIYINYIFFILCTVSSVNFLLRGGYFISFVLACVSITIKTNIYFHPLLFLATVFFPINKTKDNKTNIKLVVCFYVSFVFVFVMQELFITPYGSYSGYNSFMMSTVLDFFVDPRVYMKLSFFIPVLILFSLSKDRFYYYVFSVLSVGLIGIFYIANKFSYVSILEPESFLKIHPYVLRVDIQFYLFVFLLSSFFLISSKAKKIKFVFFILYCAFFLPQRYYADLKMSSMVSNIRSVYSYFELNDDLVGKGGMIKSRIEGTSVANYHYYKIFGDTQKISYQALNSDYQAKYCKHNAPLVYRKKGICNEFVDWGVVFTPSITYAKYSARDLWFK